MTEWAEIFPLMGSGYDADVRLLNDSGEAAGGSFLFLPGEELRAS